MSDSDLSSPPSTSSPLVGENDTSNEVRSLKRLGYIKPQSQPFSSSASKRSSVMSLGRIDHLQHRFARGSRLTGQARTWEKNKFSYRGSQSSVPNCGDMTIFRGVEEDESEEDYSPDMVPLPPSPIHKSYTRSVSHEFDPTKMQKDLKEELFEIAKQFSSYELLAGTTRDSQLFLDVFNVLTANLVQCVRSARSYASSIPSYQSIAIPFAVFREEALEVLATVKHALSRHPCSGFTDSEYAKVKDWTSHLGDYIESEKRRTDDETMDWLYPSFWDGKENLRHHCFLAFYDTTGGPLVSPEVDTVEYLRGLSTGKKLCRIYNALIRRSRKPFGLITKFHEDTTIRYRVLENLRFWRAAVNYRLDTTIPELDTNEIYLLSETGRNQLSDAVTQFCRAAIEEMVQTVESTEDRDRIQHEDSRSMDNVLQEVDSLAISNLTRTS